MRIFRGHDLASLHRQVVPYIKKNCYKNSDGTPLRIKGENGQDTIESPEIALVCDTPFNGDMFLKDIVDDVKILPFTQMFMDQYAHDLLNGSGKDFVYEYNDRLVNSEGVNQLDYIYEKLSKSPVTRRAVAKTWQPSVDCFREDVPCLQLIHFTIRDYKLHMKVVFRSEDMHLGLGPNMYGLVQLQMSMCRLLGHGIEVGTYTHIAFCPHLYWWRDEDMLTKLL